MVEKAKALRFEYREHWYYYNARRKAGFIQRVRNLAANISNQAEAGTPEALAMMYLDHIATWLNLDLKYGNIR
jgi:hypothetical protein